LGVSLGDKVLAVTTDINYSTYALTFTAVGIFKTGFTFMDKNLIYIPIEKAQEMLDCYGATHEILLLLEDPEKASEISSEILTFLEENGLELFSKKTAWRIPSPQSPGRIVSLSNIYPLRTSLSAASC
jgi:ABC-type lipoprotein release transport system permease subunit